MSEWYVDSNHMLQGPRVIHRLLPEAGSQPFLKPTTIILHSQSGPRKTLWTSLWAWMARKDIVIESHFIVDTDGTIIQTMPLNRRADCNFRANSFAVSFETQDEGYPTLADTPWSAEQIDTIIWAVAAIGHKYGIPYTQCAVWNDPGVDYHSKFALWSAYRGKTCPGAARIRQMDYVRQGAAVRCACQ